MPLQMCSWRRLKLNGHSEGWFSGTARDTLYISAQFDADVLMLMIRRELET